MNHLLRSALASGLSGLSLFAALRLNAVEPAPDDTVVALERLNVEMSRSLPYGAARADSATKLNLPLVANPKNIQVLTSALLVDQAAGTLEDALHNVASITPGGYYANWDYYRIRGFNAAFNTFIDGLRGGNGMAEEPFGFEQVQIVKGPASSLFGSAPVGGVVNLVSKRPQRGTFADVVASAGSFNGWSASVDLNAPLGESVQFRLPVLFREQDSWVEFADSRRWFVAPALTWQLSPATQLTLLTRYSDYAITHAMPLPALGTVQPNPNGPILHERFVGEPGTNKGTETTTQAGYEFTHAFSRELTIRQHLRYDGYDQVWDRMLYPSHLGADQHTLYRYPYNYWQTWHDLAVDTRLEAAFLTGTLRHELLAGVEFFSKDQKARAQTIDFADPAAYMPLDLYHPVYGSALSPLQPITRSEEHGRSTGLYLHDHVHLPGGVTLTAGLRHDRSKQDAKTVTAVSPRAGASWLFRPGAAVYATYSEASQPQFGFADAAGGPVAPESGENWEVGFKSAAPDGRLTATIAAYHLTRRNVATADPSTPGAYLVSGEQRSRGIEIDGQFQLSAGWELIVAYAYTDARITADRTLPAGARVAGVPYHGASAWTKYTFQRGPLAGFGLGAGWRYYGPQAGDVTYTNPFQLPGYSLVETALYFQRGRFRVQVNAANALDRAYYVGAYSDVYVMPGAPRTMRTTVSWRF